MAIRDILKKIVGGGGDMKDEMMARDGLTPDEVELEWYRRKQYLANVKRELKFHRERERQVLWKGRSMNDKHQIIKAKNVFKGQKRLFTK